MEVSGIWWWFKAVCHLQRKTEQDEKEVKDETPLILIFKGQAEEEVPKKKSE